MRFLFKSLSTTAGRVLATGLQFLTVVLIAAYLGAEAQGNYAFLLLIPLMAAHILDMGLSHANLYLIGKGRFERCTILNATALWSLFWGVLTFALWMLFSPALQPLELLKPFRQMPGLLHGAVLAIGLTLFFNIQIPTLLGWDRIRRMNLFLVGRGLLTLILTTLIVLGLQRGLRGAFFSWLLSLSCASILLYFVECQSLRIQAQQLICYYREALSYGLKAHLGSLCMLLMYRLDHLLVMHFRGSADLGRYHLATLVAESLLFITGPLYLLTIPRTAREGEAFANRETPRTFRMVFWAFAFAALPLFILFQLLVAFLSGTGYEAGNTVTAFALLLPGVIFLGGDQIISGDLSGRGRQILNTLVASGMLVVNVGLDLWWIPRYGILGAAAATSIAYVAGCLITLGIFIRLSGVSWKDLALLKREDWKLLAPFRRS